MKNGGIRHNFGMGGTYLAKDKNSFSK